jgi:ATP-dependent HslUV protease subunit HslV
MGMRRNGKLAIGGDGQVTISTTVVKATAHKIRKLYNGQVIMGFAGATSDAFTLYEKFEDKLKNYKGNLRKAAVELAKEWRSDRILRRLEALMIVGDAETILLISGNGDVLEPDDGMIAIGSGGNYALAAARALAQFTDKEAAEIVHAALDIAADICIYTNHNIMVEEL